MLSLLEYFQGYIYCLSGIGGRDDPSEETAASLAFLMEPIKYFSFWDVPRNFAFERGGNVYLITSGFDDALDEYPDDYEVFVVSGVGSLSMVSDWKSIEPLPKTSVGRIPVASVQFDKSHRKYVDGSFLDTIRQPQTK